MSQTEYLLSFIRGEGVMSFKQQLELTMRLSIPAIVAQLSYIVMQYIDCLLYTSDAADEL